MVSTPTATHTSIHLVNSGVALAPGSRDTRGRRSTGLCRHRPRRDRRESAAVRPPNRTESHASAHATRAAPRRSPRSWKSRYARSRASKVSSAWSSHQCAMPHTSRASGSSSTPSSSASASSQEPRARASHPALTASITKGVSRSAARQASPMRLVGAPRGGAPTVLTAPRSRSGADADRIDRHGRGSRAHRGGCRGPAGRWSPCRRAGLQRLDDEGVRRVAEHLATRDGDRPGRTARGGSCGDIRRRPYGEPDRRCGDDLGAERLPRHCGGSEVGSRYGADAECRAGDRPRARATPWSRPLARACSS